MANFALRAAALALALAVAGCDARSDIAANSSVTVKLPPARPAVATPGFAFQGAKRVRN